MRSSKFKTGSWFLSATLLGAALTGNDEGVHEPVNWRTHIRAD